MAWSSAITSFFYLGGFWCCVSFFNHLMRSCMNHPYIWLMERSGVEIDWLQIKWTTTRYNRLFTWLGTRRPKFLKLWYNVGACIGVLLIPVSLYILIGTILSNLASPLDAADRSPPPLTAAIPGVNLPMGDATFLFVSAVICIIVHELGHGLAAVGEDIRVLGCGLKIVVALPAAFVDFSAEQLLSLPPWHQLRICCAGIWHNVVLALLAILASLVMAVPIALGYTEGTGVSVESLRELLPSGLMVRDQITGINGCRIMGIESWSRCMTEMQANAQLGFCIPDVILENYSWNSTGKTGLTKANEIIECCPSTDPRRVCFGWINPSLDPQKFKSFSCIPARELLKESSGTCYTEDECTVGYASCVQPTLDNITRLLQVSRTEGEDALYVTEMRDFANSVGVTSFIPKHHFLPLSLPSVVEKFLSYVTSLSLTLAILNAVPCDALDGKWMAMALVELFLARHVRNYRVRELICTSVVVVSTLLLLLTVFTGLRRILESYQGFSTSGGGHDIFL